MNEAEIQAALKQLKDADLKDFVNITVGLANTTYRLTTNDGEVFILRHLILQTPDNARVEARLQKILNLNGVVTPTYLKLRGKDAVGDVNGKYFTISKKLEGHTPTKTTLDLVHSFGETLAKIHDSLAGCGELISPSPTQWMSLDNVEKEIEHCSGELRDRFTKLLLESKGILDYDLPKSVIHSDLFLDNTFGDDKKITVVFDFETAEYTTRLLDIARTYLPLIHDSMLTPKEIKHHLLAGYDSRSKQPLTKRELDLLPKAIVYVAVACASWLQNNNGEKFVSNYLQSASLAKSEMQ